MQYLRQSTASQEAIIGPFIDDTDFKTAKTALTIANTDVKLWKCGATAEVSKNSGGGTHIANGRYYVVFDATDTNTLGSLRAAVLMAASLQVWEDFVVLEASEYDRMFATTGPVPSVGIIARGTAQAATSTTIQLAAAESFADSVLVGMTVLAFGSTQNYWQSREITAYTNSTDTATVDAWTVTPSGTITYVVMGTPPRSATNPLAVNVTQVAGDSTSATNLKLMTNGTGGVALKATFTGSLTGDVGGNVTGSVNSVTQPVSVAPASIASIQSAGNVTKMNGATLTGDGSPTNLIRTVNAGF